MKVQSLLLADAASSGPDGKIFIHGTGVNSVQARTFPWSQPQIAIFLVLERENEVAGSDHELALDFLDPNGNALDEAIQTNVRMPSDVNLENNPPMYLNVVATFNGVVFVAPGLYWVRASVDGVEAARIPLQVEEIPTDRPDAVGDDPSQ